MASAIVSNLSNDGYSRFEDDATNRTRLRHGETLAITVVRRQCNQQQLDYQRGDEILTMRWISETQFFFNYFNRGALATVAEHEIYLQPENELSDEADGASTVHRSGSPEGASFQSRSDSYRLSENPEMSFHEAAIYLEEGLNNEKFDSHPSDPEALPAYLLVHNTWYYSLDLITSILLLFLAFCEEPAVSTFALPVAVHSTIELLALLVISIELGLKLRWIGWRTILRHKRTALKGITLVVMFFEALVVLIRQTNHFRVTRALRPIFLVDTRSYGGVRRFIRQILQSMPPILDMMGLLLFLVSTFALLGYFLFSSDPLNSFFSSLSDSFVSMFVLLTTANFPDVMMAAYAKSRWNALFFILYLCIVLYALMNLMLAVVYEAFTRVERDKFRKLLLHRREGCRLAFRHLVGKRSPARMNFRHFDGVMRYYAPQISTLETILMFRYLDNSGMGSLSEEDFDHVYDAVMLSWEPQSSSAPWFRATWEPLQRALQLTHDLVQWKRMEDIINSLIILNGVAMGVRLMQQYDSLEDAARAFCASWDTILFLALFSLEFALKALGMGLFKYFASGWNVYDFCVTLGAIVAVFLNYMCPSLTVVVILRPLRLLRLFKLRKRYRDVFGTLVLLTPLMSSAVMVMVVLYYFFAIIGMELFAGYNLKNCCNGTAVEDFYKWSNNNTAAVGFYYLNNFENLAASGVTLFELMVVNNWFIVMNAYAAVAHPASRIYFMLFYLVTSVVLTIVVASVLEAFRFRIQYKRQTSKRDEEKLLHVEVSLEWQELSRWLGDEVLLDSLRPELVVGGTAVFFGRRPRNREVLQQRMYRTEIDQWMREAELNDQRTAASRNEGALIGDGDQLII